MTSTSPPIKPSIPLLRVVAAALVDESGRLLIAQRPVGKVDAGRWEFPGGKIGPGETPQQALQRELKEELGIDVAADGPMFVMTIRHVYNERIVELSCFLVRRFAGQPASLEGQDLVWVAPADLGRWDILEADRPFTDWLQTCLI